MNLYATPLFFSSFRFLFPSSFSCCNNGEFYTQRGRERESVSVFVCEKSMPYLFHSDLCFYMPFNWEMGGGSLGETGGCTVSCSCQQHKLWCPGMLIMCWSMVLVKAKHTLHMSNLHLKDGTLVPFLCSSTGCLVDWLVG